MGGQAEHRASAHGLDVEVMPGIEPAPAVLDEEREILGPLAERRHVKDDPAEAKVEIVPEAALVSPGGEVAVGGGDDADIDAAASARAHGADLALGQEAEERRLGLQGQLADLVEEDRAAVGRGEQAGSSAPTAPVNAPRSCPKSSLSGAARVSARRS